MRVTLPVLYEGCFTSSMEQKVEKPIKPIFYTRYVEKIEQNDSLFDNLNNFYKNIKLI